MKHPPCSEEVYRPHMNHSPCANVGRYEHEGKHYCFRHHPKNVAKRAAERQVKYDAQQAAWKRKYAIERAERLIVAAADVCVDNHGRWVGGAGLSVLLSGIAEYRLAKAMPNA